MDAAEFLSFWDVYPRKVGKLAAMKAYQRARKHATAAQILTGLQRYLAHMPEDPQFRPHPTTWLNQGRWEDEYEHEVMPRVSARTKALAQASEDFMRGVNEQRSPKRLQH